MYYREHIEQLGIPVQSIIKLDANENPYGPPPGSLKSNGKD